MRSGTLVEVPARTSADGERASISNADRVSIVHLKANACVGSKSSKLTEEDGESFWKVYTWYTCS